MKQVIKSIIDMILMKSIFCNDEHEIISRKGLDILSLQSNETPNVADDECEKKDCTHHMDFRHYDGQHSKCLLCGEIVY